MLNRLIYFPQGIGSLKVMYKWSDCGLEGTIHLKCSVYLWTDWQLVFKWITNLDLHLMRFVKRRVDKILRMRFQMVGITFIRI